MKPVSSLRASLELLQLPSRAGVLRSQPLPPDMRDVLLIAAGDDLAVHSACIDTGQPRDRIVRAAQFFIEQIVLAPDSDSYRALGAVATASGPELRGNMALLMRWLHPDTQSRSDVNMFAERVVRAWEDVKTPERRAAYDERLRQSKQPAVASSSDTRAPPRGSRRQSRPNSAKLEKPFFIVPLAKTKQPVHRRLFRFWTQFWQR